LGCKAVEHKRYVLCLDILLQAVRGRLQLPTSQYWLPFLSLAFTVALATIIFIIEQPANTALSAIGRTCPVV
jgi:hypothetical protein